MKRFLIIGVGIFFLISFLSEPIAGEEVKEPDFRKVRWGVSKEDVKKVEKAELIHSDEETLAYQDSLYNYNVIIIYFFAFDQLTNATYVINEKYKDRANYILDFKHLKSLLEKKYGKPAVEESVWNNNLYKEDTHFWGTAIAAGHLILRNIWETEKTKITQYLRGQDFIISHRVDYSSKELEGLKEKVKEKKALEDL